MLPSPIKNLNLITLNRQFDNIPPSLISLLARIVVGLIFFKSGLTKIDGFGISENALFLFENEYALPLIPPAFAAYMATIFELSCPIFLFAGLFSRIAAALLLSMTLVIQIFVYPDAYITHGLWAIALLIIMRYGSGKISLDYWIIGTNYG